VRGSNGGSHSHVNLEPTLQLRWDPSLVTQAHRRFWAMEANCLGYDHAKHSHSCILTHMEDGLYSWANQENISEA
jgi:hypothetical protein